MTESTGHGSQPSPVVDAPGPSGVLVLGMHRSGTSAVTRLVNLLGPSTCVDEDLLMGTETNTKGHWESKSLYEFNERLLADMGCTWWHPPTRDVLARWERGLDGARFDEAGALFERAHPSGPWVWKDPRTCVTLSFWRRVLVGPVCGIVVFRNPLDVARSLEHRDYIQSELGLALWMRYSRLLLEQSRGMPVMVSYYDDILEDPETFSEGVRAFLADLGMAVAPDIDRSAAREFIDPSLRHSAHDLTDLGPTAELIDIMRGLTGVHPSFAPPELGPEPPWVEEQFQAYGPEWHASWKVHEVHPPIRPLTRTQRLRALVRRAVPVGR